VNKLRNGGCLDGVQYPIPYKTIQRQNACSGIGKS
jgi:hypothetical protein